MPGMYAPPAVELPNTRQIGRDARLAAPGEIAEAPPSRHEDLALVGEVRAGRLDEGDGGQAVLIRHVREAAALDHGELAHRAALHRGLARGDHALHARDHADATDDAGAGRVTRHVLAGQRAQLEEVRVAIEQELDALARQQLAGGEVSTVVLVATADRRRAERGGELGHGGRAGGVVDAVVVGFAIELRAQDRIRLLGHGPRRDSTSRSRAPRRQRRLTSGYDRP
jgi:hypothetical protein